MDTNIWTAQGRLTWPHARVGHVFIGEVILELGRAMFADWNDEDPAAEYSVPGIEPVPPTSGRRSLNGGPPGPSFEVRYAEHQRKHAEWTRRSQQILVENEKIFPAFNRSRTVFDLVVREARSGHLPLFMTTSRNHMLVSLPDQILHNESMNDRLVTGKADLSPRPGHANLWGMNEWIFVREDFAQANRAIAAALSREAVPVTGPEIASGPAERILRKEDAQNWYRDRVAKAVELGARYSRQEDELAGRDRGISRTRIRELRNEYASDWTKKDGRPTKT